ncbi:ATP-binding protein [Hymenobacter rubripertinctus]|uniref:ATP-binding protein n=1 Tax=Hymenobacter rubripertinctus TaxID=2029981 RepID=A0A418R2V7_9BACT|nr:ATP-binding protein [Hymenobacter rubripertinctus]RIY11777.1 ATP-binding protein [Hymenobacter rubripertinctus]
MARPFSPSVNIVRDATQELSYLPTPNAQTVFGQLINNYLSGIHCFNIVGAYGTGKSAFLWAFQQTLSKQHDYFQLEAGFKNVKGFHFEHFVGQYASLKQTLAQHYVVGATADTSTSTIIAALDDEYRRLAKKKSALVLVVDEFGKFLEYAAKENPEEELYFIQELAEYINDSRKEILLLTTVHQDVSAYSLELTRTQRQEWDKVKGRLKELTFNEPVEQLLFLAAQQLGTTQQATAADAVANSRLFEAIAKAQAFPLRDYFSPEMQQQLWPMDLLSAAVLVQALQRYGQNERSLFTFLQSNDYLGLQQHSARGTYFNLSRVYDYLSFHYYSLLTSKYNPHFAQWAIIRSTLEQLEKHFEVPTDLEAANQLVKTIGMLSIFAPAGAEISSEFLETYAQTSLDVASVAHLLQILVQQKLLRLVPHKNSYILFEGTDLDIELAIDEAGNLVEQVTDVATRLQEFFTFPYIAAKQISFEKGTPRIFEVRMTEEALLEEPKGEVDGFVNLIFSDTLTIDKLQQTVGARQDAVLYGIYERSGEIKKLIREIDKVRKVRDENLNDKVARRELNSILEHQEALLRHYVIDNLYAQDGAITWFTNGPAQLNFKGRRAFNRCLSNIAAHVYTDTPVYRSELVNKTKLSTPIATARKNFMRALFENWQYPDLGFPIKNFPPEKTIYLSLLKETGIHQVVNGEYALTTPTNASFQALWQIGEEFLQRSQEGPLKISELMQALLRKPLKLKQGLVDFWVPLFLFMKRHEFALYGEQGKYIPEMHLAVVDLFTKSPALYTVKAFALLPEKLALFNDYRELLQLGSTERVSNATFIESIKPFLTMYKQLPAYAQHTRNLPVATQRLRESISTAKDPEAAFFEKFPGALGFNLPELQRDADTRERYVKTLQVNIARLLQAYPALLTRMDAFISSLVVGKTVDFDDYKRRLQERFKGLEKHRVPADLRVFQDRVTSKLDDRESWLNSMATCVLGKSLTSFEDADERRFQDEFQQRVHELDNLCELAKANPDAGAEDIFRLGIAAFGKKEQIRIIRRPKQLSTADVTVENEIRALLGTDKARSLAILARLLQEQL